MGRHGVGWRRRQRQATHLLPHITRDALDGRLHCGHHPLGFLETIQARLAEMFLLGNRADRLDGLWDIPRNALAVATHAAGADALRDLLALGAEALVLLARRFHLVRNLRETWHRL